MQFDFYIEQFLTLKLLSVEGQYFKFHFNDLYFGSMFPSEKEKVFFSLLKNGVLHLSVFGSHAAIYMSKLDSLSG